MAFDPNNVTMMDAKTGSTPSETADIIIDTIKTGSAFMSLAKAVEMTKPVKKFPIMSGVGAFWVGEGQKIQTSKPTFVTVEMVAKKLAVIIPTTKENLKYSVTDFFTLMEAEIAEAFYKKFDQAAFGGIDTPFAFSVKKSATDAGNTLTETANKYDDISKAMGLIEAEDLDANAIASRRGQKMAYRNTKDADGLPIFAPATAALGNMLLGLPVAFADNESFKDSGITEAVGNWDYAYYGMLSGLEYEILTEATLTTIEDSSAPGEPLSLAERDMSALKVTMEIGLVIVKDDAFAIINKAADPAPEPPADEGA